MSDIHYLCVNIFGIDEVDERKKNDKRYIIGDYYIKNFVSDNHKIIVVKIQHKWNCVLH